MSYQCILQQRAPVSVMFSCRDLLCNGGTDGCKVVLMPNGFAAMIDRKAAQSESFVAFLQQQLDDNLTIGEAKSYIFLAHELGDISQQDAMIYMAAASVSDPMKYKVLSEPEGMPIQDDLEPDSFMHELVKQLRGPGSPLQQYPMLIRLM